MDHKRHQEGFAQEFITANVPEIVGEFSWYFTRTKFCYFKIRVYRLRPRIILPIGNTHRPRPILVLLASKFSVQQVIKAKRQRRDLTSFVRRTRVAENLLCE